MAGEVFGRMMGIAGVLGRMVRWCWGGWMLGLLLWVGDGDGEVWDMRGAVRDSSDGIGY